MSQECLNSSSLKLIDKLHNSVYDEPRTKRKSPRVWTPEEDAQLCEAVRRLGRKNWKIIAQAMGERRTADQCCQRWIRVLNPNIVRSEWSSKEDLILTHAVRQFGERSWREIVRLLPGRTDIQCRYRWFNGLRDAQIKLGHHFPSTAAAHEIILKSIESLARHIPGEDSSGPDDVVNHHSHESDSNTSNGSRSGDAVITGDADVFCHVNRTIANAMAKDIHQHSNMTSYVSQDVSAPKRKRHISKQDVHPLIIASSDASMSKITTRCVSVSNVDGERANTTRDQSRTQADNIMIFPISPQQPPSPHSPVSKYSIDRSSGDGHEQLLLDQSQTVPTSRNSAPSPLTGGLKRNPESQNRGSLQSQSLMGVKSQSSLLVKNDGNFDSNGEQTPSNATTSSTSSASNKSKDHEIAAQSLVSLSTKKFSSTQENRENIQKVDSISTFQPPNREMQPKMSNQLSFIPYNVKSSSAKHGNHGSNGITFIDESFLGKSSMVHNHQDIPCITSSVGPFVLDSRMKSVCEAQNTSPDASKVPVKESSAAMQSFYGRPPRDISAILNPELESQVAEESHTSQESQVGLGSPTSDSLGEQVVEGKIQTVGSMLDVYSSPPSKAGPTMERKNSSTTKEVLLPGSFCKDSYDVGQNALTSLVLSRPSNLFTAKTTQKSAANDDQRMQSGEPQNQASLIATQIADILSSHPQVAQLLAEALAPLKSLQNDAKDQGQSLSIQELSSQQNILGTVPESATAHSLRQTSQLLLSPNTAPSKDRISVGASNPGKTSKRPASPSSSEMTTHTVMTHQMKGRQHIKSSILERPSLSSHLISSGAASGMKRSLSIQKPSGPKATTAKSCGPARRPEGPKSLLSQVVGAFQKQPKNSNTKIIERHNNPDVKTPNAVGLGSPTLITHPTSSNLVEKPKGIAAVTSADSHPHLVATNSTPRQTTSASHPMNDLRDAPTPLACNQFVNHHPYPFPPANTAQPAEQHAPTSHSNVPYFSSSVPQPCTIDASQTRQMISGEPDAINQHPNAQQHTLPNGHVPPHHLQPQPQHQAPFVPQIQSHFQPHYQPQYPPHYQPQYQAPMVPPYQLPYQPQYQHPFQQGFPPHCPPQFQHHCGVPPPIPSQSSYPPHCVVQYPHQQPYIQPQFQHQTQIQTQHQPNGLASPYVHPNCPPTPQTQYRSHSSLDGDTETEI